MTLDQRRIEARRNACCPCFSHSDWRPNRLSQKSLLKIIFSAYSKILTRTPVKVISIFLGLNSIESQQNFQQSFHISVGPCSTKTSVEKPVLIFNWIGPLIVAFFPTVTLLYLWHRLWWFSVPPSSRDLAFGAISCSDKNFKSGTLPLLGQCCEMDGGLG